MAQLSVLNCSEITFRLLAEGTERAKRSQPESWALLHASDNWRRRWRRRPRRRSASARQEHGFHTHGRPCCENKMPFKIIKAQEKCIFKAEDVPGWSRLQCSGCMQERALLLHVECTTNLLCWILDVLWRSRVLCDAECSPFSYSLFTVQAQSCLFVEIRCFIPLET